MVASALRIAWLELVPCVWFSLLCPTLGIDHWPIVEFRNKSPYELILNFVAAEHDVRELVRLNPEYGAQQNTFVGHRFRIFPVDKVMRNHLSVDVEVIGAGLVVITLENSVLKFKWVNVEHSKPKPPEFDAQSKKYSKKKAKECLQNLEASVARGSDPLAVSEDKDVFCMNFALREFVRSKVTISFDDWKKTIAGAWDQLGEQVRTQPASLRNFTKVGYSHLRRNAKTPYNGRLDKLFQNSIDSMIDWYEGARKLAQPEEHGILDPSVSSYESDTWIVHPPREMSKVFVGQIKKELEKWAGMEDGNLKYVAFYGPRLYRNGSVLRQHVDIWETHVISAIVAVGRRGLQKPWPLEIVGHDGETHRVNDEPGDVTFYESASCPHGRPWALHGREVANIFVHFKPSKGWAPLTGSQLRANGDKVVENAEL